MILEISIPCSYFISAQILHGLFATEPDYIVVDSVIGITNIIKGVPISWTDFKWELVLKLVHVF